MANWLLPRMAGSFKAIGKLPLTGGLRTSGQATLTRQALTKWAGRTMNRAQKYPPQQPTDYVRTGNLGRNYTMRVTDDEAVVSNNTPYFQWVQGENQTGVMAGKGWQTLEECAIAEEPQLVEDFRKALLE